MEKRKSGMKSLYIKIKRVLPVAFIFCFFNQKFRLIYQTKKYFRSCPFSSNKSDKYILLKNTPPFALPNDKQANISN